MKRFYALLFFVYLISPSQAFASECSDPSKVVIGFFLLFSAFTCMIFSTALLTYWLLGGKRLLKMWSILILTSVLVGILALLAGLLKEQNKSSDRIPFLSAKDC
jgi:hypothetical protein